MQLTKFDKYLLSQLMVMFGFFALVLSLMFWINRAVILFDQIIASGHTALVFLEISALMLPTVIRTILPISVFASALYVANRLASDSELVVVQSNGYSPFRLARPVLMFGVLTGLLFSILAHFLVPTSQAQLRERQNEISTDVASRLLREGTFFHPGDSITFYIAEIEVDGTLHGVFLNDTREPNHRISYSAETAHLAHGQGTVLLVMANGLAQNFRLSDQTLATTRFAELIFDLGAVLSDGAVRKQIPAELRTSELLWPTAKVLQNTRASTAQLAQEAHNRFSQAIFCIVGALIGFSAILVAGFSRFSLWKQAAMAIMLLISVSFADNYLNDFVQKDSTLWPLAYLASIIGLILAGMMLWISARTSWRVRRTVMVQS